MRLVRREGILMRLTRTSATAFLAAAAAVLACGMPAAAAEPVVSVSGCGALSAEYVGTFVSDWSVHLDDDAFMQSYLGGAGTVPAAGATDAEHACLIDDLVANLQVVHPGFGADRDPNVVHALLGEIIFGRGQTSAAGQPATHAETQAPASNLSSILETLRNLTPTQVPSVTPELSVGATTHLGADAVLWAGPSAVPLVTAHAGLTYAASDTPLPGVLGVLPTPARLLGLLGKILDSVTYRVCAESATLALKCSLPQPLATPILVDDSGDNLPDVSGTLLPLVTPAGGAQLQFTLNTLLGGKVAPAHVFAVFSVLGTNRQFAVGFDGRASLLSRTSILKFTLKSIARALTGDIDTGMSVVYKYPGSKTGITVDMATITDANTLTDPVSASLDFDPTPETFGASLRIQEGSTPEYTAGVQSSVPTVLSAHASIVQSAAGSETAIDARVDKLPTSVTVDVKNSGSAINAHYSGSAKIDDLAVAARQVPAVTDPGTFTLAAAHLTQIPTDINVLFTKPYDGVLSTSSPIGPTQVALQSYTDGIAHQEIFGDLDLVPTNLHLHGDVNGAGDDFSAAFTYAADASVPNVHFRLFDDADLHAFVDATAQSLPKWMRVSVAKHPHDSEASFDARTSESADPGSASVGPIALKYTSTGTQLADADLPSTDYVVMKETANDVQAALKYTGLALVSYALHDDVTAADHDTVSARLKNAGPRVLTLLGDTPALTVNSVVDAVPADMQLSYEKLGTETDVHYHASSVIDSITAAVTEKQGNHASVGATVQGVPDDVVIKADQAAGTLDWTSSGGVDHLGLSGQVDLDGRTWTGGATLSDVPTSWGLHFGGADYSFRAGTVSDPLEVGGLVAYLTNHGGVATESGNHAFANYDQGTGDLDASFTMSDIRSFSYTPNAAGFVANAQVGGGLPFHLRANIALRDGNSSSQHLDTVSGDAVIDPLPTSMTITQHGTAFDYDSNTSPDIDGSFAVGRSDAVAVTPAPPLVRGASLRDGRACDPEGCATGLRARLFMQGFPSGLHADLAEVDFGLTHYAPPAGDPTLNADVVLDSDPDASKHFAAKVTLAGIDPSGTDMEVGPIVTVPGPVANSATTTVSYTGNHAVGPLDATVVQGDKTARVTVSNLPVTMTFAATTRPDGIEVSGDLHDPITKIEAFYKPTGSANWALTAKLTDIPRNFDFSQLTIGDQPSSDPCAPPPPKPPVPTVNYTASNGAESADTLDIAAAVDLHQLSSSLSGQVSAGITNLGHDTHASWDGTQLTLDSVPRTDAIEVHVPNARVIVNFEFDTSQPDPCNPDSGHDFISISAAGHVNVVVDIGDAGMSLTDVSHIVLQPGFSTGITGDFGNFSFGWSQLHVSIDAAVEVDLDIDFGGGIEVTPTLASLAATIGTDVHVDFGIYHQEADRILHLFPIIPVPCDFEGPIPTGVYFIDVFLTPKRVATGHDGFSIAGSPGSTQQYVITANPFGVIPDLVLDGVTGLFTSPFPHGLDAGFDCG
jgi:hypothetical protein